MIFAAYKSSVLSALDRLSRVVKSNPRSVDILQCVEISTYGSDVYVTAISSMASARVLVRGAIVGEGGTIVVNADRLRDRVSKAGPNLKFECSDSSMKIISSEDQKLGLSLNDPREFPSVDWVEPEESYGLDKNQVIDLLQQAYALTVHSSALTPAILQAHIQEGFLWVSNGTSYQKFPIQCNPALVSSIPTSTLFPLIGFMKEVEGDRVWFSQVGSDKVVVSVGSDQFQVTPLAVEFPDISKVFDRIKIVAAEALTIPRKRLVSELTKAKSSLDSSGRISLGIQGTAMATLVVTARADNGDWYEGAIPVVWEGSEDRQLSFNLDSLLTFLKTFNGEEISVYLGEDFRGDLSPAYISEEEHVGIIHQFRV